MDWSDEQEEAIDTCTDLKTTIACVTGPAGTGKTSLMREVYARLVEKLCVECNISVHDYNAMLYDDQPFKIKLSAPTGRAAKRIEEATGIPAVTIHRMLRFSVPIDEEDFGLPEYSRLNRMPYDVILVDEASMITMEIWRAIIDGMKRGAIVRFFGDKEQLPPIPRPGETIKSPFADALKRFESVLLTTNYRSNDGIVKVADAVIKNKIPISNDQVQIVRCHIPEATKLILDFAKKVDFTSEHNQIIIPTKHTKHGTEAINRLIQQKFNPEKDKITIWRIRDGVREAHAFKRGDKILWDKNDYEFGLMNGTLGRVLDFDKDEGTILLSIDGRDVDIPPEAEGYNPTTGEKFLYDPRTYMLLGYAITTHRAQGSQFDTVLYAISRSRAATRQNVYTGITRARTKLYVLNLGGALSHAIDFYVPI